MNLVIRYYVKNSIRQTCYKHKFYLREFIEVEDKIELKIEQKDRDGFKVTINASWPVLSIVKMLPTYKKKLIDRMTFSIPKEEVLNDIEYDKYTNNLKAIKK